MIAIGDTGGYFHLYGPSHRAVLLLTVLGAAGLPVLAARAGPVRVRVGCRALAITIALVNLAIGIHGFDPAHPVRTLPLQLSDLAPYLAAIALWTRRRWAAALTAYWCLTLSTQALITPVLRGPDFPSPAFIAFFADHVLVIWAAIVLVWGLGIRPGWAEYRFSFAVTAGWAAVMLGVNRAAGTDYGFLNAKPSTPSVLDLLGPWPWYLVQEAALVAAVWAGLTLAWRPRTTAGAPGDRRPVRRPRGG